MDKTKNPGIAIDDISLVEANISLNPPPEDESLELEYHVQLTGYERSEDYDDKRLFVRCCFDLMGGIEKPPFDFTCTFMAVYSVMDDEANMTWKEFTDVMALAHVIPFLREFVANMTNRQENDHTHNHPNRFLHWCCCLHHWRHNTSAERPTHRRHFVNSAWRFMGHESACAAGRQGEGGD